MSTENWRSSRAPRSSRLRRIAPSRARGKAFEVARRCDHPLELGDRRVRLERGFVDVRAQLLLDRAEQIDAPERVKTKVGRERRVRMDGGRWQVRDLRDDTLHIGQWPRGAL